MYKMEKENQKNFTQVQIGKNLYLGSIKCNQEIEKKEILRQPQHIIYCVDISGSMNSELAELRRHLKNHLVSDSISDDTYISIIAFSGKSQCYTVAESLKLNDLRDIDKVHKAIDKYLVAMCLTAFLPPLQAVKNIIKNFSSNAYSFYSLIFMTDGYNNDSPFDEVLSELESMDSIISSATFIEYGYYADSNSLLEMAGKVGGQKIFAKDFESYQIEFDKIINQKSEERIAIPIDEIKTNIAYPYVFGALENGNVVVFSTKYKKEVLVPTSLKELFYFSKVESALYSEDTLKSLYLASYVLLLNNKFFDAEKTISIVGDIALIKDTQGCFGKQKLNRLRDKVLLCYQNKNVRMSEGHDPSFVPNDNQYCIVNLINDLSSNEENRFFPDHDKFSYNRTGVKMEIKRVESPIGAGEIVTPEFVRSYCVDGYPLTDLVYNSERANISMRLKIEGDVLIPKNQWNIEKVPSFIWRNYTIIRDGIVNFRYLPTKLSSKTMKKLEKGGVKMEIDEKGYCIIDLESVPIVNKKMVSSISAKELAKLEIELIKIQSAVKFLKTNTTSRDFQRKTSKFIELIGNCPQEFVDYVNSLGITEFNGFQPAVEAGEATDSYMACSLKTKVSKMSSVPKIDDVKKKINEGKKLTLSEQIVKSEMDKFYGIAQKAYYDGISEKAKENINNTMTEQYLADLDTLRRDAIMEKAKIIFSLIITRSWFKEFASMDENEVQVEVDKDIVTTCKFEFKDEEIYV